MRRRDAKQRRVPAKARDYKQLYGSLYRSSGGIRLYPDRTGLAPNCFKRNSLNTHPDNNGWCLLDFLRTLWRPQQIACLLTHAFFDTANKLASGGGGGKPFSFASIRARYLQKLRCLLAYFECICTALIDEEAWLDLLVSFRLKSCLEPHLCRRLE